MVKSPDGVFGKSYAKGTSYFLWSGAVTRQALHLRQSAQRRIWAQIVCDPSERSRRASTSGPCGFTTATAVPEYPSGHLGQAVAAVGERPFAEKLFVRVGDGGLMGLGRPVNTCEDFE